MESFVLDIKQIIDNTDWETENEDDVFVFVYDLAWNLRDDNKITNEQLYKMLEILKDMSQPLKDCLIDLVYEIEKGDF